MTSAQPIAAIVPDDLVPDPMLPRNLSEGARANSSFGEMLMQGIGRVNADLLRVQDEVRLSVAGAGPDLHRVMVSMEESRLAFQLLLQVRSKLLEAYQDIIKMQV